MKVLKVGVSVSNEWRCKWSTDSRRITDWTVSVHLFSVKTCDYLFNSNGKGKASFDWSNLSVSRAMAAEAEAAREARAKVIAAEGEQKASR